jgi:lipoate-protein ligase A
MIEIIETLPGEAEENMAWDSRYLASLSHPCLHIYHWKNKAATYGYFLSPHDFFREGAAIDLARRPTGGGVVIHIWDLAFSFFLPVSHPFFYESSLDNYRFVNEIVWKAVKHFLPKIGSFLEEDKKVVEKHFCMAHPTKYDVVIQEKKIIGAAQRRTSLGYMHQGTISLFAPDRSYLESVLVRKEIVDEIFRYTYVLFPEGNKTELTKVVSEALQKEFSKVFS